MRDKTKNFSMERWHDTLISFWSKKTLQKIKKGRLKKFLQNGRWNLKDATPMNHLLNYLNGDLVVPEPLHYLSEFGVMSECTFELTVWHNKPCLGEEGPNPSGGYPAILRELVGNELYFSLNLFENSKSFQKYSNEPGVGYHKSFICEIRLDNTDFTFSEKTFGDMYIGLCTIPFEFTLKGKRRDGFMALAFNHEYAKDGECTISYNNIL